MTASPNPARNTLTAATSPLMFGPAGYAELMRRQFETVLGLTTAWATAMSAASATVLAPASSSADQTTEESATPRLTVIPGEADSTPTATPESDGPGWLDGATHQHSSRGMLHWLTAAPTLHPNLFDEAVVLLVDEDIKTAS